MAQKIIIEPKKLWDYYIQHKSSLDATMFEIAKNEQYGISIYLSETEQRCPCITVKANDSEVYSERIVSEAEAEKTCSRIYDEYLSDKVAYTLSEIDDIRRSLEEFRHGKIVDIWCPFVHDDTGCSAMNRMCDYGRCEGNNWLHCSSFRKLYPDIDFHKLEAERQTVIARDDEEEILLEQQGAIEKREMELDVAVSEFISAVLDGDAYLDGEDHDDIIEDCKDHFLEYLARKHGLLGIFRPMVLEDEDGEDFYEEYPYECMEFDDEDNPIYM